MAQLDALPYQVYLLAYDLDKHRLFDRTKTAFLTRAAVLIELALRGQLSVASQPLVTRPDPTGDPVLDRALAEVQQHVRTWKALFRRDYRQTLDLVEQQLESAGVIELRRRRLLGLVPRHTIHMRETAAAAQVQDRVATILLGGEPAAEVSDADAALVVLASVGHVRTVISRRDRHSHARRVDALTVRLGAIAPGLAEAVRDLEMTMIAAQGGS
jgi:Golgi phosphoprotein 3 (GPP34)